MLGFPSPSMPVPLEALSQPAQGFSRLPGPERGDTNIHTSSYIHTNIHTNTNATNTNVNAKMNKLVKFKLILILVLVKPLLT